jgi:D-beta-D-heptose 7-phosphate kinase/D-beta-D-heptose 1-phosphate adenosyltransferase
MENESASRPNALKIAVIGDIMLDVYVDGTVERLNPEAPNCLVLDEVKRSYSLGGSGNVAHNLVRFGVNANLCGTIGIRDHIDSMRLSSMIHTISSGPKPGRLNIFEIPALGRKPTVKTRCRSSGQQLLRVDNEDSSPVPCDVDSMTAIDAAIKDVNAVILSDYAKGVLSDDILTYLFCQLAQKKIPYLVDPKRLTLNDYSLGATARPLVISPNNKEFKQSIEYRDRRPMTAQNIVVTDGRNGCYIARCPTMEFWDLQVIPSKHEVAVADPSGAGDTFIAALATALLSGASLERACQVANYAAACVVKERGVVTLNDVELQEFARQLEQK